MFILMQSMSLFRSAFNSIARIKTTQQGFNCIKNTSIQSRLTQAPTSLIFSVWRNNFSSSNKDIREKVLARYPHIPAMKTITLDTPEYHALFTPALKKLVSLFEKYNYELRIAGGAVRDLLLGKQSHDIDFATTATPEEMKELFEKEGIRMINAKGEAHGTITCRIDDQENFEVTTLRIDVVTDGRHAEVEFTRDWQLDALRRDLTINSMFLGFDGTVYDYFCGMDDLKQRNIRFVGQAADRIREDYLRILRYFRFYGRIATEPDVHEAGTLHAIKENMDGLKGISGERLWVEFKKIVVGRHAEALVERMAPIGITGYLGLPSPVNLVEWRAVMQRSMSLQPQPMTVMAALMDTEEQVNALHARLKLSKEELRTGIFIIMHREDDMGPSPMKYCQDLLCDTVGKEPKTKDKICELLKYLGKGDILEQFNTWNLPKFPVSGVRLLESGVPKGPTLARALNGLRQKWKETDYKLSEEELLKYVDEVKKDL